MDNISNSRSMAKRLSIQRPDDPMSRIRIATLRSFDHPPVTYFKIHELATHDGHFIEWPEIFSTSDAALAHARSILVK